MGSIENQVATAADVQLISGGQIVAKMLILSRFQDELNYGKLL